MPWCPKCRNEYREGFTVCADCGVELVDVLGEEVAEKEVFFTVPRVEAERILEYFEASNVHGVELEDNEEGSTDLLCDTKKRKEIMFVLRTYLEERKKEQEAFMAAQNAPEEARVLDENNAPDESAAPEKPLKTFVSSKTKADDAKNSAIALFLIGIAGLIFEALVVFHVLPLTINGVGGIVIYSFMGCVFLGLVIASIFSFATAKRLNTAIVEEDDLTEDILKFCREEVVPTAKKMIPDSDTEGDETNYFARMDFMKSAIKRDPRFSHLDISVIDGLLDENYHKLFS